MYNSLLRLIVAFEICIAAVILDMMYFKMSKLVHASLYMQSKYTKRNICHQKKTENLILHKIFQMDIGTGINTALLCLFNVAFMVAGIFLNSVVLISLWRSSQLRKKLCYFMILVLSCFDLAVVAIMHPLQNDDNMHGAITFNIGTTLNGFSMFALLVLNIERFLALSYPFFHQTSVTKRRLMFLLVALMILFASLLLLFQIQNSAQGTTSDNYCIFGAVHLPQLQYVYNCEIKTRQRQSCRIRWPRKNKAQVSVQIVFYLFIDGYLLFRLFLPTTC